MWTFSVYFASLGVLSASLSCSDIEDKGSGSAYTAEELQQISSMEIEELKNCLILLGKEQLTPEQSSTIWKSLLDIFGTASDIPEGYLRQLGWVMNGIPPPHFGNMSLTDVDTIASFGRCKELSSDQLTALKNAVLEQWRGKEMDDLTSFDLSNLKQIICAFNSSLLQMIHPISYKDAALELATLSNCPSEVMEELANLATNPSGFGDAAQWTSVQLANVGCIIVGLSNIRILRLEAMEGLTPAIINCLPPSTLQAMSDGQISRLSPAAASALSSPQLSLLSDSQKYALSQAIAGTSDKKNQGRKLDFNYTFTSLMYALLFTVQ